MSFIASDNIDYYNIDFIIYIFGGLDIGPPISNKKKKAYNDHYRDENRVRLKS